MLTFTLAISCLITSNLPWFLDLLFQVPMQYCSLQHWTLFLSPVPSTTGYCFCFASMPSFFLELFLHWSPVAYWAPTDLGSSSFSILSFCLLILFMGYCSWGSQGKNTEVVCHSLLQWTTCCQTSPPWPNHLAWPHMAWLSFIEWDKTVVLWSDWLVFCDYGFSLSALWCPLQNLPSYLGFSYLGHGVSLHGCSSNMFISHLYILFGEMSMLHWFLWFGSKFWNWELGAFQLFPSLRVVCQLGLFKTSYKFKYQIPISEKTWNFYRNCVASHL